MAMLSAGRAWAQTPSATATAQQVHAFDLEAQPLNRAALRFSEQAGVQLVFGSPVADGVTANAVRGSFTVADALDRLLAGTNMRWRYLGDRTITIESAAAPSSDGTRTFGAVQVEGAQAASGGGFADLGGFGAGAGINGSSDATATEGSKSFTTNGTSLAGKSAQSMRETPQSVAVITSEQIKQQNLNTLTDVLNQTPGLSLTFGSGTLDAAAAVGPPVIVSRGYQITTYSVDGGGPLAFSTVGGAPDMSEYDHVEILRGSSVLAGQGDPGGILNLQRKRPLDHEQVVVQGQLGSWANHRIEADVTGPVAFDGHVRGRLVGVYQDNDFFYHISHLRRYKLYGTIEADLGSSTLVRVGASYDNITQTGVNPGGLPRYLDGGDLRLPRSTCFCAPWGDGNSSTTEVFANIERRFGDDWLLKINGTRVEDKYDGLTAAPTAYVTRGAPTTTSGRMAQVFSYDSTTTQYAADANLTGKFNLFGLTQKVVVGGSYQGTQSTFVNGAYLTNVTFDPFAFDPSVFGAAPTGDPYLVISQPQHSSQYVVYGNLMLNPVQKLHFTAGLAVNFQDQTSRNIQTLNLGAFIPGAPSQTLSDVTQFNKHGAVATPSLGVTYDVAQSTSLYASYNSIYKVRYYYTAQQQLLPPVEGMTWQGGIKTTRRDGALNASLSYYYTKQSNQVIGDPSVPVPTSNCCFINVGSVTTQGIDMELSGALTRNWQIQAGYTYNHTDYGSLYQNYLANVQGTGTQSLDAAVVILFNQQPKHQIKLWTSYQLPDRLSAWSIGAGFRLESARTTVGSVCGVPVSAFTGFCPATDRLAFTFTQRMYTVQDLRIAYDFSKHWQAQFNVTNVADQRYYATAGTTTSGNFYGEPRKVMLAVRASY